MTVGDLITYNHRRCRVTGFDPIGAGTQRVHLEDLETGDRRVASLDEVRGTARSLIACPNPPGGAQERGRDDVLRSTARASRRSSQRPG